MERIKNRIPADVGAARRLVGAVRVLPGSLVHRVGTGAFVGLTVTAALLESLLLDPFGWLRVPIHPISATRLAGAILMGSACC